MILNRISLKASFFLFSTTIFLLFAGCGQKTKIKGSEFVAEDVLVQVISDMHIIDAITNDMKYYRKFNPGDSVDLYTPIFEKYNITMEMYELTIDEYSKYPQILDAVYDAVLMNLNLMQDKIEKEDKEEQNNKVIPKMH